MSAVDRWFARLRTELAGAQAAAGPCHDLGHVMRVAALAERIARAEGRDVELCVAAALLHDIGHAEAAAHGTDDHEFRSAARAASLLAAHLGDAARGEVVQAIAGRRFKKLGLPRGPVGEVLDDADNLDALGLVGVARAYLWRGEHGMPVPETQPGLGIHRALADHWREKLSLLDGRMHTVTGRQLATARKRSMQRFLRGIERELRSQL